LFRKYSTFVLFYRPFWSSLNFTRFDVASKSSGLEAARSSDWVSNLSKLPMRGKPTSVGLMNLGLSMCLLDSFLRSISIWTDVKNCLSRSTGRGSALCTVVIASGKLRMLFLFEF
jgi:hypothetical protein